MHGFFKQIYKQSHTTAVTRGRAFARRAGGRGFVSRPRHTKSFKTVPVASLNITETEL